MSGFILKMLDRVGNYTHVLDVLFAKTTRLLWTNSATPDEDTSTQGVVFRSHALGVGPGAIEPFAALSDLTVSGGTQLLAPSHGLAIQQGYIVVIVASDNAADLGVCHISGFNANSIGLSIALLGSTVSIEIYKDSLFTYAQGKVEACASILDETDAQAFGWSFNTYIKRGASEGTTSAFLVRVGGDPWPDATFGEPVRSAAFAVYRCWFHDGYLFDVKFDGVVHVHKALGIGCEEPRGLLDCTPTDPYISDASDVYTYPWPCRTTAQIAALTGMEPGACVFDTDQEKLFIYKTGGWVEII